MGKTICGIELVPLNVPLKTRLQTATTFFATYVFFFGGATGTLILIFLLFTRCFWITLLYAAWLWWDRDTTSRGGRRVEWMRRIPPFYYLRDYFPLSLVKTADLDPSQNYIMGYHPHGMMGYGTVNFYGDVTGFKEKFPGIKPYVLMLKFLLMMPFARELLMAFGCCDVSKQSIDYIFQEKGRAVVILIGGARETFDAKPHMTALVLKERKGFIKMAMKHGAHLVPCFTFGENELYRHIFDNRPGSRTRQIQRFIQKHFGVSPVFFTGRGLFNYTFGIVPIQTPVVTVVGRPIMVGKDENPSQEQIDQLHGRYMDELEELFETHKAQYGYQDQTMEFIA